MARILVINPNSSETCSAGISATLAPLRHACGPVVDVVTLQEGPPAIYSWRDWHAVVEPMCRLVEQTDADAYVIACASDPGIEAVRATTRRPVLGIFRSAVAAAVARAERFGVIALVESSKARHRLALRAMGLADRLAGEVALNLSMEVLLDPAAARDALIAAGRDLAAMGAETVILGCTGMAHHAAAVRGAVGLPVIEPAQAAVGLAAGMLLADGVIGMKQSVEA
ncbi:MAG TPA: aspartate/glutamate racemase family protein [Rhodopila sp.]